MAAVQKPSELDSGSEISLDKPVVVAEAIDRTSASTDIRHLSSPPFVFHTPLGLLNTCIRDQCIKKYNTKRNSLRQENDVPSIYSQRCRARPPLRLLS